jgi:hypothetical protein
VSDLSQIPSQPPVVDELNWILQRARQGDDSVLPQLKDLLEHRPELWNYYGDLAVHAQEAWLRLIAGADLALRESTARKVEELKRELAGPRPSAMERLLVDRVGLCWLQLHQAEVAAAQAMSQNSTQMSDFWLKRQDSANRRFLGSLGALATLRRLLPAGRSRGQLGGEIGVGESSHEALPEVRSNQIGAFPRIAGARDATR